MKAIKYSEELDFKQIFSAPGQCISVFIPKSFFSNDNMNIYQQNVYGSRPYHISSDLVAIAAHMGITYPVEKVKKNSPLILETSPEALFFEKRDVNIEETKIIDNDLRYIGCVVNVISVEPQTEYPSLLGFSIRSHSIEDTVSLAIDVCDYILVTDYEHSPKIVDDPMEILTSAPAQNLVTNFNTVEYPYSPEFFKNDIDHSLFKDYSIRFITDTASFKIEARKNELYFFDDNETKPIEPSSLKMLDNSIRVGDKEYTNVSTIELTLYH